jgi:hypothetical protein
VRVRLNFDVQGDTLEVIQRRAEQVVKEFTDGTSGVTTDLEIEVQPTTIKPDAPMPDYSFTAHVFARIKP